MTIWLRRRVGDFSLLLVALGGGTCAVWALRQTWARQADVNWPWLLLVGAGLMGGAALRRSERWLPDAQPVAQPVACPSPQRRSIGYGLLLTASALTISVIWILWPAHGRWEGPFWMWLLALALAIAGGALLGCLGEPAADQRPASIPPTFGPPKSGAMIATDAPLSQIPRWLEVMLFLVIAGLAIGLRVYRIDTIPPAIFGDETAGGLDALNIIERGDISPFATGWAQIPNGYSYYMAGLIKLMGANWAMLKTASLLPAILTVVAIYPLGRLLFGPLGGLCAMLFMAVSRWHLTMSRWGWIEVAPPLFQILATFLLIRGLRERRAVDFVLGGVVTGLMMYTYLSCRLALVTLVVFSVYWIVLDPDGPRAGVRRHWRGITIFFLVWAITFGPLALTYIKDPYTFFARVSQVSILNEVRREGTVQPLTHSLIHHLKAFHQAGDLNGRHNLPGEPQTDPITGLLFVVGVGYSLLRLRDRRRGLLLLWLFFGMAGGIFSSSWEAPHAYRSLIAVPAIVLLAGDVLARLGRGIVWLLPESGAAERPSAHRIWATLCCVLVITAALLGSAAWETRLYFGRQAEAVSVRSRFHLGPTRAAEEVISALNEAKVPYLNFPFYHLSIVRFLVYGATREALGRNPLVAPPYELFRAETHLPLLSPHSDALFILPDYYWTLRNYFQTFYPNAEVTLVEGNVSPSNLYMRVRVPAEDFAAVQGLDARFTLADGQVIKRTVPSIDETWQTGEVVSAEWKGVIRISKGGIYTFTSDGNLSLLVDGEHWDGSWFLATGVHTLHVSQSDSQEQKVARLKWVAPDQSETLVPAERLFRAQLPENGLRGYYYDNPEWHGTPVFEQNAPFLMLGWPTGEPFPAPFSARFVGTLRITTPGSYSFIVQADDGARMILDGEVVGSAMVPYQANSFQASVLLAAGDHPIQIDYFQMGGASGLRVLWRPPGGTVEALPPEVLIPAGFNPPGNSPA